MPAKPERIAQSSVDWALLVTGYQESAVNSLAQGELAGAALEQRGATQVIATSYRSAYTLTRQEISAG